MLRFVPAGLEHVDPLLEDLRSEERAELVASHCGDPREAIEYSIRKSTEAFAVYNDDTLLCLTGAVSSLLSRKAVVWLLTTNALKKQPKYLIRNTKALIAYWCERYDVLMNYIDYRYKASLRWAEWAGFDVSPPEPLGKDGQLFCKIELRKS